MLKLNSECRFCGKKYYWNPKDKNTNGAFCSEECSNKCFGKALTKIMGHKVSIPYTDWRRGVKILDG